MATIQNITIDQDADYTETLTIKVQQEHYLFNRTNNHTVS